MQERDVVALDQKKISDEDRQSIEIIYLKITNLDLQRKLMAADIAKADKMIGELQQQMIAKTKELEEKYGLVIGRDNIGADGTIKQASNGVPAQV